MIPVTRLSHPHEASPAMALPGPPRFLTGLPATGEADLTWAPPDDDGGSPITGYQVQRSLDGTSWEDVARVVLGGPTATAGRILGQAIGTPVQFRVAAQNAEGTGPAGPPVSVTPLSASNGTRWRTLVIPRQSWRSIIWADGKFVALADTLFSEGGPGVEREQVITSPDGETWTSRSVPVASLWQSLAGAMGSSWRWAGPRKPSPARS